MENKATEKKAYEKPVVKEIGRINEIVLSNGIYGNADGSYVANMAKYNTFYPDSILG